jgi:hypothetical protein
MPGAVYEPADEACPKSKTEDIFPAKADRARKSCNVSVIDNLKGYVLADFFNRLSVDVSDPCIKLLFRHLPEQLRIEHFIVADEPCR